MCDNFDSGDDDLSTMLIMDEMDDEDRCFDVHNGCLTSVLIMIVIPIMVLIRIGSVFK